MPTVFRKSLLILTTLVRSKSGRFHSTDNGPHWCSFAVYSRLVASGFPREVASGLRPDRKPGFQPGVSAAKSSGGDAARYGNRDRLPPRDRAFL
jgi:hypothetical protein